MKPLILICFIAFSILSGPINIPNSKRNIQRDGFLLEWDVKNAKEWGAWSWDARATPEGLAGYFTSENRCPRWEFDLESNAGARFLIRCDTINPDTSFYRIITTKNGRETNFTVEWLIPWKILLPEVQKKYLLKMSGRSACNDALNPIEISGEPEINLAPNVPRRIAVQFAIIALLAFVLWRIKNRIKSKKHL
ncbi:MAG: hypothetical protein PHC61_13450 [Chitinivibrionales bacterium]|nr:hypothetical protein [Chitinivibrionales bacterium]